MFASSLLILFSSKSLALAFLRSAMNCTSPRIELLFPAEDRPRKPAAAALASLEDAPASRKNRLEGSSRLMSAPMTTLQFDDASCEAEV